MKKTLANPLITQIIEMSLNKIFKNIFLSIGSNENNRKNNLNKAINEIIALDKTNLIHRSPIYETKPMYYENQRNFLNMVIEISTSFNPEELLKELKYIEKKIGRNFNKPINTSRVIDIDIVVFDNLIINEKDLIIPHKGIKERPFVVLPLSDINPKIVVPKINKTSSELLLMLEYNQDIIKLYEK